MSCRDPAKSASGVSRGIASAACPELDGITKASEMLTTMVATAKAPAEALVISCSMAYRMVPSVC